MPPLAAPDEDTTREGLTVIPKEKEKETLSNKWTTMTYRIEDKKIVGADLSDPWNEPRCYSETRRGISKAWETLKAQWNEDTTMSQAMNILWDNKIRMHSYFAMD